MSLDLAELARRVLAGDRRAAARLITLIENGAAEAESALSLLYPSAGKAHLVGITGPPGAGKSSLVDQLIAAIRQDGQQVGVIAIDPSSPFSGGAILGDRIRMGRHASDPGVFIRSMSSRGQLGGLALATRAAATVLDAYGCEVVLIETVGVGQSEVAIAQATDSTILVLPPNLGDGIQAIKAGIMEVPDLFVVNKADLPGANQAAAEIFGMLELDPPSGWAPPVLMTRSLADLADSGVPDLWKHLQVHRDYLTRTGLIALRRRRQVQDEIATMALEAFRDRLNAWFKGPDAASLLQRVQDRTVDPRGAATELVLRLARRALDSPLLCRGDEEGSSFGGQRTMDTEG
jgi:LAO/AO transport system kinase